jgi:hypothetical protein
VPLSLLTLLFCVIPLSPKPETLSTLAPQVDMNAVVQFKNQQDIMAHDMAIKQQQVRDAARGRERERWEDEGGAQGANGSFEGKPGD